MNVDERPPEIYRGDWEDCFRHLVGVMEAANPAGTRNAVKAKRPVAEFCGTSVASFTVWISGKSKPRGLELIKLMCWLDMLGYTVTELKKVPSNRRGFFELLGYDILTVDQASGLLGFKETSSLYQVAFGHVGANEDKTQKMWDIWKSHRVQLEEKKAQVRKEYLDSLASHQEEGEQKQPKVSSTSTPRCEAIVHIMIGLLVLLEERHVEELSVQDLAGLQPETNTVLRLSARLSDLSSRLIMSGHKRSGGGDG